MADARSLLRAARADRRVQHPDAQYTTSGKLMCSLCEIVVKDDKKAWNTHLHATQHTLRSSQAQDATRANKKRKIETTLDEDEDENKRARTDVQTEDPKPVNGDLTSTLQMPAVNDVPSAVGSEPTTTDGTVDEAEFAAFLGDLAAAEAEERRRPPESALNASATITAAPMTAADIAAQAREEQSKQRVRRDAEIEADAEDAAERLEEEFLEMEGLEDRVRRLKEKRAALRRSSTILAENAAAARAVVQNSTQTENAASAGSSDDDHDDDDDDDYEEWGFGVS